MKTLLTSIAALAILGGSAVAQDAMRPATPPADAAPPAAMTPAPAETPMAPAAAAPSWVTAQGTNELLASELIGANVYNSTADEAENLGSVNDVLMGDDGNVKAIVIGVGGFLGIGEKNVAVPFDSVQKSFDTDDTLKLVLAVDQPALEAAPAFVERKDVAAR